MSACRWLLTGIVAIAVLGTASSGASAQEAAFKAGVAVSSLGGDNEYWDDRLTTTNFGIHVRFRLGPIALQPELYVVTKGASASAAPEEEQLRLEYIEIPLLLVLPVQVGAFEPFAFVGPSLSLESRCRFVFKEGGLRTNMGCETMPPSEAVRTRSVDFGVIGGGGIAYRLGPGRVMLEARHNRGLRNIADGPRELRNRTTQVMIGYTMDWTGS